MRAAGAVRRGDVVALDRDLVMLGSVEEMVDGLLGMPAGHERRRRTARDERLRQLARLRL